MVRRGREGPKHFSRAEAPKAPEIVTAPRQRRGRFFVTGGARAAAAITAVMSSGAFGASARERFFTAPRLRRTIN